MKKALFYNPSTTRWKRFTKSERQGRFASIFQDQDFEDANLNLYRVAVLVSYFCNFISIATGFAFVYLLLSGLYADLPNWFQYIIFGVITSLFLFFLEYLKRETIRRNTVSWLKAKRINYPSLLVIVLLISLSIFLSVKGAEQFVRKVDQSVQQETAKQETVKLETVEDYNEQIKSQSDSLTNFKQSVSWKGKINISNKVVAATIAHFVANIDRLEKEKTATLASVKKQGETALIVLRNTTETRANYMIWISLGNELSCILLILWVYYYAFRCHVEHRLNEQKNQNSKNFRHFDQNQGANVNPPKSPVLPSTLEMNETPIGFPIGKERKTAQNGRCETQTVTVLTGKGKHTQGFKITCGYCETEAIKFNKNARFCSEACRNNFHSEKYKKLRKAEV